MGIICSFFGVPSNAINWKHKMPSRREFFMDVYALRQEKIAAGELDANPDGEPSLEEYLDRFDLNDKAGLTNVPR